MKKHGKFAKKPPNVLIFGGFFDTIVLGERHEYHSS